MKYSIFIISVLFCISTYALEANITTAKNSPVQNCYENSICKNTYNIEEHVGNKIAIRKLWLLPMFNSTKNTCDPWSKCHDFYEMFEIFAEVENITSNPILLTSSNIELIATSKNIKLAGEKAGRYILSNHTTKNLNPKDFYLMPGDVITIGFTSGLKLSGIFDFFTSEIKSDIVFSDMNPAMTSFIFRVTTFNNFIKKKYGRNTKIKLQIFEENRKEVITTYIPLAAGGDIFSVHTDNKKPGETNPYYFQYDSLLGEVIYRLNNHERDSSIAGKE